MVFPVYFLRLGKDWQVVFPKDKPDIGHTDFWEETVSRIVADHYKIPRPKLVNLPYCQPRARIVGNRAKLWPDSTPNRRAAGWASSNPTKKSRQECGRKNEAKSSGSRSAVGPCPPRIRKMGFEP